MLALIAAAGLSLEWTSYSNGSVRPAAFVLPEAKAAAAPPKPASRPAPTSLDSVVVYPNPWKAGAGAPARVVFDQLPSGASLTIFTVAGKPVRTLTASGTRAEWDLNASDGRRVASGFYLYVARSGSAKKVGRLAVIR